MDNDIQERFLFFNIVYFRSDRLGLFIVLTFCRQRHREKLWQDIEAVTGQFIANQIVQSLCVITLDGTERLRDFTNKIDIRKDAEKLKFKYEQGHLVDVSSAPSTLLSVRQLLEVSSGFLKVRLRPYLHQAKVGAKAKKIREQSKKITASKKFFHTHLVWIRLKVHLQWTKTNLNANFSLIFVPAQCVH